MDSMDCCATSVQCPMQLQEVFSMAPSAPISPVPDAKSFPAQTAGFHDSTMSFAPSAITSHGIVPPGSCPPLFRLHSQLLV